MVPFVAKKVWIISNKAPEDWWKKGLDAPMQRRLKDPIGRSERMDYGVWEPLQDVSAVVLERPTDVVAGLPAASRARGWFAQCNDPAAIQLQHAVASHGLRLEYVSPYHRDGCAATGCTYEQSVDGYAHVPIPGEPNLPH